MVTRTKVRALVRAVVVVATAFGLKWSAEQVAAVQVLLEAVLQVSFKDEEK